MENPIIEVITNHSTLDAIFKVQDTMGASLWLSGGWVRDSLMGKIPKDIDLVTDVSAEFFCKKVQAHLGHGALVGLGAEGEEAARLVIDGETIDISSFRRGAKSVEADLLLRDFTINAMARTFSREGVGEALIDPCGGQEDMENKVLRHLPTAFASDPLRLLRAYRFSALYGFTFSEETAQVIPDYIDGLDSVAAERKMAELSLIIESPRAAEMFIEMGKIGILEKLLPELAVTKGMEQPDAHHLDVYGHSLLALNNMTKLLTLGKEALTEEFGFPLPLLAVEKEKHQALLWAALLHDIGKKPTYAPHIKDGRPTYYGHDHASATLVGDIAKRLKWSKSLQKDVQLLVDLHMYPFHLYNAQDPARLSARAALKLYRKTGDLLLPLFYMCLADSLASLGPGKPIGIEEKLMVLYGRVQDVYETHIKTMEAVPPLINGHDVMSICSIAPGPKIREILLKSQELQVEGELNTREDALFWLKNQV